ncbi:uncharacterized protein EI90DRAFT_562199 [Cantharellus anzutake]|uniref:uncharacterized protein n=1 Tax=Cantharellus anzutake TaxID=1750568 RepID=UPI0019040F10|nr:uncharacterized protein EI90DRAFT_562199 [Cantharellus anzutake]KAF8333441.1 hypothetical protein EI90DRAFT_562199 [Cantharellus anzutake]
MTSPSSTLDPTLNFGSRLSASRYAMTCALTIAAWDTLVLTSRTWHVTRTKEWPPVKIVLLILRYLMPIEYIILGVIHFKRSIQPSTCNRITPLEPIMTASLLLLSSFALVLIITSSPSPNSSRMSQSPNLTTTNHPITNTIIPTINPSPTPITPSQRFKSCFNTRLKLTFSSLFVLQLISHIAGAISFQNINVGRGKGCISGLGKGRTWAGIFYLGATLVYLGAFAWVVRGSVASLKKRPMSLWKVFVRDSLGLYGTIAFANLTNTLFVFIATPRDNTDPIRTVTSSLSTALTVTATMRIVLSRTSRDGTIHLDYSHPSYSSRSAGTGTGTGTGAGTGMGMGMGTGTGTGTEVSRRRSSFKKGHIDNNASRRQADRISLGSIHGGVTRSGSGRSSVDSNMTTNSILIIEPDHTIQTTHLPSSPHLVIPNGSKHNLPSSIRTSTRTRTPTPNNTRSRARSASPRSQLTSNGLRTPPLSPRSQVDISLFPPPPTHISQHYPQTPQHNASPRKNIDGTGTTAAQQQQHQQSSQPSQSIYAYTRDDMIIKRLSSKPASHSHPLSIPLSIPIPTRARAHQTRVVVKDRSLNRDRDRDRGHPLLALSSKDPLTSDNISRIAPGSS